jgi:hypothetical protein
MLKRQYVRSGATAQRVRRSASIPVSWGPPPSTTRKSELRELMRDRRAKIKSGAVTYDNVTLVHPDGKPMLAGDLIAGRVYEIDPQTGVVIARNRAERRANHPANRI